MFSAKQTPYVEEVPDEVQTTSEKSDGSFEEKVNKAIRASMEDLQGEYSTAASDPQSNIEFFQILCDITASEFGLTPGQASIFADTAMQVLKEMGLDNGDPNSPTVELNMRRAVAVIYIAVTSAPEQALIGPLISMQIVEWKGGADPLELLAEVKAIDEQFAATASRSTPGSNPFAPLPQGNSSPMMWRRGPQTSDLPAKEEKKEEESSYRCTIL